MITDSQIEAWLREDIGHHDVTNQVPGETSGRLVAKEGGIVAGLDAARAVFGYLGVDSTTSVEDGERVEPGEQILAVDGGARDILRGERVVVNLVAHAAGIATKTRRAVDRAEGAVGTGTAPAIAATRKTTPGLRGIEKRAVVAGGGDTHRLDLSHMVMVKDNQIAELGLEEAIERFDDRTSFATQLDVEVERVEDAPRAAAAGADVVLLDNMTPTETSEAVDLLVEYDALAEASGGIGVEEVPAYAETGVDIISMGALTHSAPALDLSFRTGV